MITWARSSVRKVTIQKRKDKWILEHLSQQTLKTQTSIKNLLAKQKVGNKS